VNSAYYKRGNKVKTVDRAIIQLGLNTVKTVSLGLSLINGNRKGKCEEFDYDYFWSNSLARAAVAHSIIRKDNIHTPSEAFTVGLLCQIGRLILATAYPEEYSRILKRIRGYDNDLLPMLEQSEFRIDHNALTAEMMKYLKLPESYYQAVLIQDENIPDDDGSSVTESQELARILQMAKIMSEIFLGSNDPKLRSELDDIIETASYLGVQEEEFPVYFDTAKSMWGGINEQFKIPISAVSSWQEIYEKAS